MKEEKRMGRPPSEGPRLVYVTRTNSVGTIYRFKVRVYGELRRQGLMLNDLAAHLGISKVTASRLFKADSVDEKTATAIAEYLGYRLDDFFNGPTMEIGRKD